MNILLCRKYSRIYSSIWIFATFWHQHTCHHYQHHHHQHPPQHQHNHHKYCYTQTATPNTITNSNNNNKTTTSSTTITTTRVGKKGSENIFFKRRIFYQAVMVNFNHKIFSPFGFILFPGIVTQSEGFQYWKGEILNNKETCHPRDQFLCQSKK